MLLTRFEPAIPANEKPQPHALYRVPMSIYHIGQCFSKFMLAKLLWLQKITTDPHNLAHINVVSG